MIKVLINPVSFGKGFPTSPSNALISDGCPTIQLNSYTTYMAVASDPTSSRAQFHKAALTSDANHKSQATRTSGQPPINWRFP